MRFGVDAEDVLRFFPFNLFTWQFYNHSYYAVGYTSFNVTLASQIKFIDLKFQKNSIQKKNQNEKMSSCYLITNHNVNMYGIDLAQANV